MSNSRRQEDSSVEVRTFGVTFRSGQVIPPHQVVPPHTDEWHQLVYAARGTMTVRTDRCAWMLPPQRALWIPSGVHYAVQMKGEVALRMLYLRARPSKPDLFAQASEACATVNVTPLLRELVLRANQLGALDRQVPEHRRLIGVIRDELKTLQAVPLQLPLPRDPRAAQFAALAAVSTGEGHPLNKMLRR